MGVASWRAGSISISIFVDAGDGIAWRSARRALA